MSNQAKKYLIIGPAWVGDMVMAQVLFKLIKRQNPDAIIDVVAPPSTFGLVEFMPEVRNSISLAVKHAEFAFKKRWNLGWSLRKEKYDHAIVLPNSWKSALVPFFAGVKKRTGWQREMRYVLLNDLRQLDKKQLPLMIERFLALGLEKNQLPQRPYVLPQFHVNPAEIGATLEKYHLNTDKPIIALCPGAAYGPSKRWPPEYFAEVAKNKMAEDYQVWVFGAPSDNEAAQKIIDLAPGCVNLSGNTKLKEAIQLLSLANYVVTNDSGLMHIACALERKVIAIYGSSSPEFTPPLGEQVKILWLKIECSPCFQRECPLGHWRCMKELGPEKVLAALKEF